MLEIMIAIVWIIIILVNFRNAWSFKVNYIIKAIQ